MNSNNDSINFEGGEVIYCEGEKADDLFILESGQVIVVKEIEKRLVPIAIANEKDFLGEMCLFGENLRSETAITIGPTRLIKLKQADLSGQVNLCPDWANQVLMTIAERLGHANNTIRDHKIFDERLCGGKILGAQEENELKAIIKAYKEKMDD